VITGSEAFTIINGSKVIINTAVTGTGSFASSGSSNLEFGAADFENVTFMSGASGTVKFDHSLTAPFTGYLSGVTAKTPIDLADLQFTGKMTASYSGTASGGTLTVTNGNGQSVSLKLLGNYLTDSWVLSKDSAGTGTLVVDPPLTGSTGSAGDAPVHHQSFASLIHQHAAHLDLIEQLHAAKHDLLLYDPHEHDESNTLPVWSPRMQDAPLLAAATHRMIQSMASFEANAAGMMSPLVSSHEPTISDHLAIGSPGHHGG
jgi:hypothetical protein